MAVRPILPIEDTRLREVARPVKDLNDPDVKQACEDLRDTLADFRARHGHGRGIAAPQIGIPLQIIALELGKGPKLLINPRIVWRDLDTFTMWDDCMCFPGLLVRVRRHHSVSVHYYREDGSEELIERLPLDLAELIQHEVDHLEGILALDRTDGQDAVVRRDEFESDPLVFRMQADYFLGGIESEDPGF